MEVKSFQIEYLPVLTEIWYEASVKAHDFISDEFWKKNKQKMADVYLPNSETYVAFSDGKISGFISIVDEYLAALFVKQELQGNGIGTKLLSYVKSFKDHLQLKVYRKNVPSVDFYLKHNFQIISETIDKETGEGEFLMEWNK